MLQSVLVIMLPEAWGPKREETPSHAKLQSVLVKMLPEARGPKREETPSHATLQSVLVMRGLRVDQLAGDMGHLG